MCFQGLWSDCSGFCQNKHLTERSKLSFDHDVSLYVSGVLVRLAPVSPQAWGIYRLGGVRDRSVTGGWGIKGGWKVKRRRQRSREKKGDFVNELNWRPGFMLPWWTRTHTRTHTHTSKNLSLTVVSELWLQATNLGMGFQRGSPESLLMFSGVLNFVAWVIEAHSLVT